MKHLLVIGLFLVTWNEQVLKGHYATPPTGGSPGNYDADYYTVEVATHSIKLKTQEDVDLFLGQVPLKCHNCVYYVSEQEEKDALRASLISGKAFNIKVEELK